MALIETWIVKNNYYEPLALSDIITPYTVDPNETVDLLTIGNNTAENVATSDIIRNRNNQILGSGVNKGKRYLESDYQHSHDDFSLVDHTHIGLSILTGGSSSDADSLHTHNNLITSSEANSLINDAIANDLDLSDYVLKSGSINQLSDITSSGATIEEAVSKVHEEKHTLLEHIDTSDGVVTTANLITLMDGSNADCLHTHSFQIHNNLTGLDGGTSGEYYHLTQSQHDTLTDGSNADLLHTHSGSGISGNHNDLDGLQGGDISNDEMYHVTFSQLDILSRLDEDSAGLTFDGESIGGGTSIHNDLLGLQGGEVDEYYHLTYSEYIGLTGGPSFYADDLHNHNFPTTAYELPLGQACDGDWTDGLFSWTIDTLTSCALDDVNEVLSSLAPPPAPNLDDTDIDTNGVDGSLSFDSSHPIAEATYYGVDGIGSRPAVSVDGTFVDSGDRAGIVDSSTDVTGTLNEDVPADSGNPNPSYPANAFGNADQGELKLEVNGSVLRTIDLSTAGAVDDGTGTSGFDISDHSPCLFPNGDSFTQFQYRTGSYRVDSGDMRLGWNYARVIHTISGSDIVTNYVDWVVDGNTTATSFSGIVFDNLIMTGSSYLSGVRYYTGGTADYDITIDNGQRNTYITNSAITFTETNGSISNLSFDPTNGNELQQTVVTDRTFTVSSNIRLLNDDISNITRVNRTVQSDLNSSSVSITNILMDDLISGAGGEDNNSESFRAEGYRLTSDLDITDTNYGSGSGNGPAAYTWDSTESLVGVDAGHNDGLLECNDRLSYPTNTSDNNVSNGDFRNTSDGGSITYAYNGNPNYSSASGERVYLRYFYDSSSRQNFNFNFNVTNTTFVEASNIGSLSGNNVACEILAPNTTVDGSSNVEWKDMVTAYTVDTEIGAYAGTYGSTIPTDWGATIGTKSTATSGNAIVIRITAPGSWTGTIDSIECTFL